MNRGWAARLALAGGAVALLVLLVFAGVRSLALAALGLAGLAVAAAGVWWVLAHRGPCPGARRTAGCGRTGGRPCALRDGLLWVVAVSFALWTLAVTAGRTALREDLGQVLPPERPATPAARPFLVMNPRSCGGKVGKFRLADRAREMGAEVVVPSAPPMNWRRVMNRRRVRQLALTVGRVAAGRDGSRPF